MQVAKLNHREQIVPPFSGCGLLRSRNRQQTQPGTAENRQERRCRKMRSTKSTRIGVFVVFWQFAFFCTACLAQDIGNVSSRLSPIECPASDGDNIAITVEVTDKSGHPATGLEASDFKVFDNKRSQKILAFSAVDSAHPPAASVKVQIVIDAVN